MAYELLNNGPVTPHRLHALVRLVARLQPVPRQAVLDFLQPPTLVEKQETADVVLRAATACGLVLERTDCLIALTPAATNLVSTEDFQKYMQQILAGVSEPNADNYLLNEFAAWYAVQNDRVFQMTQGDYPVRFNNELYPRVEPRPFNDTKLNGWRGWAAFVGWGWLLAVGSRSEMLVPDARNRLRRLMPELLPEGSRAIPFGVFITQLAERCPELDGGVLFERAWQASRGAEARSGRLSLMLSTALRALHDERALMLVSRPDAAQTWYLFPAEGHIDQRVTHLNRGETDAATTL